MAKPTRQATSLRPGQFRHLIRVAGVSGRMPERGDPQRGLPADRDHQGMPASQHSPDAP